MRDLYSNIDLDDSIIPVAFTNSATPGDATIDLKGCNSAALIFYIGLPATSLSGSNYMTFTLTHAPDDGTGSAGSYTNVAAVDMVGVTPSSGLILTVDADAEASMSYKFGYVGQKRFLKIVSAETGTLPSTPIAVLVIKGDLQDAPPIA